MGAAVAVASVQGAIVPHRRCVADIKVDALDGMWSPGWLEADTLTTGLPYATGTPNFAIGAMET